MRDGRPPPPWRPPRPKSPTRRSSGRRKRVELAVASSTRSGCGGRGSTGFTHRPANIAGKPSLRNRWRAPPVAAPLLELLPQLSELVPLIRVELGLDFPRDCLLHRIKAGTERRPHGVH